MAVVVPLAACVSVLAIVVATMVMAAFIPTRRVASVRVNLGSFPDELRTLSSITASPTPRYRQYSHQQTDDYLGRHHVPVAATGNADLDREAVLFEAASRRKTRVTSLHGRSERAFDYVIGR